jgi:ABC-type arginine/histidine transport system permease subunit
MVTLKRSIKRLLVQTLLIFAGSFLWNLISGKDAYAALKESFAVLLIASLALAVAEAAYNYQTK